MSLFPSVPEAMNTLLLDGLLADYSPMIKSLGSQSPILWIIGLAYVLLVAITVLYMLVGSLDHTEQRSVYDDVYILFFLFFDFTLL